jgi:uncharacterized protein (TIGR02996 family)
VSDDWPEERTEKRMAIAAVAAKTEPELLAAIDHREHEARVVYADWLEEQGDFERAEYVRLQDVLLALPHGDERWAARNRATLLAVKLDAAWRVLVARPRIQNCGRGDCPEEWGSLGPTHTSDLRMCDTCARPVAYVFRPRIPSGALVVLDSGYDLDPDE